MDQTQEYVVNSLELHLFFARIMKEHAFFLKVGFLPPNKAFAQESENFIRQFERILARTIRLSDRTVRRFVLESGECFTPFTERAESQTQCLTGTSINRQLTAQTRSLSGTCCDSDLCIRNNLLQQVRGLNRDALILVEQLISLKERVLQQVNCCKAFTGNYPLLIEHILREARLYRAQIVRLEGRDTQKSREFRDGSAFWNQIMMEHALFIRGLMDPSEDQLIRTADEFAGKYKRLLESSESIGQREQCQDEALPLTGKFRDFKRSGVEGIESCNVHALILPLMADHVLREANHYIRVMER